MPKPNSAAASLYPNLPSGTPDVVRQRQQSSMADAMYAHLKPPPAKPPNPYLEPVSEQAWREHLMALSGLRRKRKF